jgi:hypothetical protein
VSERWLLIETFGGEGHDEPTVIGIGITPKGMVPLASVLGRGRYLDDVRALVARVATSGKADERHPIEHIARCARPSASWLAVRVVSASRLISEQATPARSQVAR